MAVELNSHWWLAKAQLEIHFHYLNSIMSYFTCSSSTGTTDSLNQGSKLEHKQSKLSTSISWYAGFYFTWEACVILLRSFEQIWSKSGFIAETVTHFSSDKSSCVVYEVQQLMTLKRQGLATLALSVKHYYHLNVQFLVAAKRNQPLKEMIFISFSHHQMSMLL